tara:strand:+ start:1315 stop:1902 length:588 start_codon:yes stop_codon:yes gene_type:complete
MPICVLILKQDFDQASLVEALSETKALLSSFELIKPGGPSLKKSTSNQEIPTGKDKQSNESMPKSIEINEVKLLNPTLARKERQKTLALWLMPFGFIAGLSFTKMTGLRTFESLGMGSWGELLPGALLGMFSGLVGSFAASGSVSDDKNKDIQILRKKNSDGKWLLILETPAGLDLPWQFIQKLNPIEIVRLNQL